MKKYLLAVLTAFALVASVAASPPTASASVIFNDPRIDQIASDAAGVHLVVECYNNFDVWRHDWDQDENRTFFGAPSGARGQFFIMLSPSVCFTLKAALDKGPTTAGSYWSGLALLTILHISILQGNIERGLTSGWRYDGAGSCAGLRILPQFAARLGFAQTVKVESWLPVKRHGKIVRWRHVVRAEPNPAYADLLKSAADWHLFLFGAPCS